MYEYNLLGKKIMRIIKQLEKRKYKNVSANRILDKLKKALGEIK